MKYETSAFLTSASSVLDYLLEDYRVKFSLGDIKYLNERSFEEKARKTRNKPALDFIKWFRNQKRLLGQNEKYGFLLTLRNINIHRTVPKQSFRVQVEGVQVEAGTVTKLPVVFSPVGKPVVIEAVSEKQESGEIYKTPYEITTMAFFNERPDDDLVILCRGFFSEIQGIVLETENKWK